MKAKARVKARRGVVVRPMTELIPRNLKMSTGARCRLVADIIEQHPERWDQETWAWGELDDGLRW